jgi:HlyD family secretion protein
MKKKKWLILGSAFSVVLIAVVLILILSGSNNNGIEYKTEQIKKGNIEAIVSTTGTVNPVTIVEVGSQVSGKIAKIYVDFNSKVKAGQVVAEIDPSQIMTRVKQNEANFESSRASLEKAKVNLENIKKKYDRALKLSEKELISYEEKESLEAQYLTAKSDVQSAKARLLQSQSQLDSSKVDLGYSIIKSPIDGVVILRNINVGQTVAASFQAPVLFKIANDLSKMQVECSIDEADIGKIKEGQEVKFTVDAFQGENFKGLVSQVRYSPEIVQNVVTYTTIVEVNNPGMKLLPGMTATISIITGKANDVLLVPNAALRFNPPLTEEQMREMFQRMREQFLARRGNSSTGARPSQGSRPLQGQNPGMMSGNRFRDQGAAGQRRRQISRVWILDENGDLKFVPLRTGVTDDSYTEVKWGTLKEGQTIITGILKGGKSQSRSSFDAMRRGMMFRR